MFRRNSNECDDSQHVKLNTKALTTLFTSCGPVGNKKTGGTGNPLNRNTVPTRPHDTPGSIFRDSLAIARRERRNEDVRKQIDLIKSGRVIAKSILGYLLVASMEPSSGRSQPGINLRRSLSLPRRPSGSVRNDAEDANFTWLFHGYRASRETDALCLIP